MCMRRRQPGLLHGAYGVEDAVTKEPLKSAVPTHVAEGR